MRQRGTAAAPPLPPGPAGVRGATRLRALVCRDAPATVRRAARRCAPGGGKTVAGLPPASATADDTTMAEDAGSQGPGMDGFAIFIYVRHFGIVEICFFFRTRGLF